ncbi:helix-turn-helix domain-containing protein [Bradyrhizobium sp. AZCC 2289]|uniref:helix-turn-helix domain-containing protein n=1 Tax=Bradyrhizobium sp. AZCC 2289 TaxID=3117026 RepID=UPI002FF136FA
MTRHHLSADFGSRLRQLRRDRSMTAVDLAKRVKVTPPAIWHWEHRGRTPKGDRLQAVADALGVSLATLEGGATGNLPSTSELSLEQLIRAIEAKGFSVEVRSREKRL